MTTMTELLDAAMLAKLADLHTCFPGRIESYDYTTQRASVKPLLNRRLKDGRVETLPVLSNVPVWMPRSGGASITLPVTPGDTCFVACTERSIDEWLQRGGVQTPADPRKHSLFDAVAFVGLIPFNVGTDAENSTDVLIQYAGSKVRLKPGSAVEIEAATVKIIAPETEMTGNLTVAGLTTTGGFVSQGTVGGGATITGDVDVTSGDVTADGISLKTHVHGGVEPGAGTTGAPE
jgi:hypothetical protein